MHPALIRYVEQPPPRRLRYFALGAVAGLLGLMGGLALVEELSAQPATVHVSIDRSER